MVSSTLSSLVCAIAAFSFTLTCVYSRHTRFTCEGGRGEGDKWFDGCRWCVCQLDGPLCSPAGCSHLLEQVPPCRNVGSRWRDGCYKCKCHSEGIDCVADSSCVILMQREEYQRQILSPGACVEPEDDRCVCGVDGVPSCTAEVIDRNAHPATTIALDSTSNPPVLFTTGRYFNDKRNNNIIHRIKSDDVYNSKFQKHSSYGYRSSSPKSSYQRPYRFYNRQGGYYNYANVRDGFPNKGYHSVKHGSKSNKRHINKPSTHWSDDYYDVDTKDVLKDQSRGLQKPDSLLIITNNRCRYGVRWYGGSLRCYCNENGSITCGDPRFVATRIDGFRLEKGICEEGHRWYDEGVCQVCECKTNGVVLCRRAESCPLPFLIEPVPEINEDDDDDVNLLLSLKQTIERRSEHESLNRKGSKQPYDEDTKAHVSSLGSSNEKTIDLSYKVNGKPPLVIKDKDYGKYTDIEDENIDSSKHTVVIVTECNPGSRWLDGCKRCRCDLRGRKHCDDSRCLKAAMPQYRPRMNTGFKYSKGRPYQRPPTVAVIRDRPVQIKPRFPLRNPCGRFKVNQRYFVKCNRCLCTPHGPKCTAINCG